MNAVLPAAAALVSAAILAAVSPHLHAPAAPACGPASAERLQALEDVAKRIYASEATGAAARQAVARIADGARMRHALRNGSAAAVRAEALRRLFEPARHVVRVRVVRGSHTVTDVGGRFVVAGAAQRIAGARVEAAIQDVIGFVKLVDRQTGLEAVVRGTHGHVAALVPALAHARLPRAGVVTVGGRKLQVASFTERGFDGEPLTVWLLEPA